MERLPDLLDVRRSAIGQRVLGNGPISVGLHGEVGAPQVELHVVAGGNRLDAGEEGLALGVELRLHQVARDGRAVRSKPFAGADENSFDLGREQ